MAKIRDPARDEAKKIYLENKGITNREIANRLNVDEKKIATWKYRDNWDSTSKKKNVVQQNKNCSTANKKKQIIKAKTMVISGSTLEEASNQTGLNKSTLKNYSAKENWIDKQEKYMQKVYGRLQDKLGEQHIEEIEEAIKSLIYLRKRTMKDVISGEFENLKEYSTAIKNICEAMDKQSKYLGLPEMKMYIRQDKDKDKETENEVIILNNIPKEMK